MVLVGNGSALNVCPFRTVTCLRYQQKDFAVPLEHMKTQGGRGMKALEFTAGPVLLKEKFQVLDIPASFNLLLGRPWIHAIEAVPSTLHQKVKQGNHVISILGDSFLSKCRSLSWQNQSRNIYPCLILVTMSLMEMFRSPRPASPRNPGANSWPGNWLFMEIGKKEEEKRKNTSTYVYPGWCGRKGWCPW